MILARNSRISSLRVKRPKQSLEILNSFLGNSRFILRNSSFCRRNSRIPYYVIPQLDWGISIWNSRIFVIASEAKQSLEILNLSLGNSRIYLGNSRILLALVGKPHCSQIYKGYALNRRLAPKTPLLH